MLRTRVRAGPVAGLILSLALAAVLTFIQGGDRFIRSWAPRWGEPAPVTLRVPYGPRFVSQGPRTRLRFEDKRTIVPIGTVLRVGAPGHEAAVSFAASQRPPHWPRFAGMGVIDLALALGLTTYLRRFTQHRLRLLRTDVGLVAALAGLTLAAKAVFLFTGLPPLWFPAEALALVVATAFDRRTASLVAVLSAVVVASLLEFDLVVLCALLARGVAATLLYLNRKQARQMVLSGLLAGASSAALYTALVSIFEGGFDVFADLSQLWRSELVSCVGGGAIAGLLAALSRPQAEALLGNVPRERLLDLTDLSQPLLQKLARQAPGTFEHSRAMANLAEQAASAIGADALLTRVGAYYHDVGKSVQPKYFVENLMRDEPSPHDRLDPEVSADAIMAHVVVGTQMLRQGRIPEAVVEFCYTHHGTGLIEYFWNKCRQQGNPKQLDASAFTYPGMKPQTKETAILMLVDSIEAASRTIDRPDREQVSNLIQRIVFTKLEQGQLDQCGLSMSELRILATRLTDTLVSMYHHRIKYQWQIERAEEFGVPSQAVRAAEPVAPPPDEEAPFVDRSSEGGREEHPDSGEPIIDARSGEGAPREAEPRSPAGGEALDHHG